MTYSVRYVPLFDAGRKGLCDFFIKITYKMFPEMMEEFDLREYDKYKDILVKMNGEEDENDNWIYKFTTELPYGEIKVSYHFRNRQSDSDEKIDLPE